MAWVPCPGRREAAAGPTVVAAPARRPEGMAAALEADRVTEAATGVAPAAAWEEATVATEREPRRVGRAAAGGRDNTRTPLLG